MPFPFHIRVPHIALAALIVICMLPKAYTRDANGGSVFIEHGRPLGVIYLEPDSNEIAHYAALELRDHWQEITGTPLPIVDKLPEDVTVPVVFIGPSDAAKLRHPIESPFEPEEYLIVSGPNWLILAGDDSELSPFPALTWSQQTSLRHGTLTAVYQLLERFYGVRWFMPGNLGTVIPNQENIIVPDNLYLKEKPTFSDRLPRLSGSNDPSGSNYQPRDGDAGRWMLRVGFGRANPLYFNHTFRYLNERHNSGYAKEHQLFTKHPEIYAILPDGSRDFNTTSYRWGYLCLSEPKTAEIFVDLMRWYFDTHPYYQEFSIVPNDVWVPCLGECCLSRLDPSLQERIRLEANIEEVRGTARLGLSPALMEEFRIASSDILWEFISKVAWQIYESHPDKLVGVLGGYGSYGDPRIAAEANLPPNIAVTITKARWGYWDNVKRQHDHDMVEAWSKVTPHLYVWEYYIGNWRGWSNRPMTFGYPVFFPTILQQDMDFMKQFMKGEKIQNENWINTSPGLNHLMTYLTGKLLFNPELRVQDLLDDYYPAFYGQAHETMRAFWEHAERCWMRDTSHLGDYRNQSNEIIDVLYPPEDMALFFQLLEQAKGQVAPDSPEYRRIALIEEEISIHKARALGHLAKRLEYQSSPIFPEPSIDGQYHEGWNPHGIHLHPKDGEIGTTIRAAHDPQNLYLTFFAEEHDHVPLPSSIDRGWWYWKNKGRFSPRKESNAIVIEIRPNPGTDESAVFLINVTGKLHDAWYGDPEIENPASWNSHARVATETSFKGWSGTIAIPWDSLKLRLSPGMGLDINISRTRGNGESAHWVTSNDLGGTFYFPED